MFKKDKSADLYDARLYELDGIRKRLNRCYRFKLSLLQYLPCLFFYLFFSLLWFVILSVVWTLIFYMFFDMRPFAIWRPEIRVWFGVPGSGKTSMAAWLTRSSNKFEYKVLSNVPISGALKLDVSDLGQFDMSFDGEGCSVILDEGSLSFDNRNYMNFAKSNAPQYFALHRHQNNRVDVFSQAYDIDKRIRDRVGEAGLFLLKKSRLKGFVRVRFISKVLTINKEDKQMIDGFKFRGLPRFVYCRGVWQSFDTVDRSLCPQVQKNWQTW